MEEELVSGGPQERNWKGIGIALLVIVIMCALITVAVVLLEDKTDGNKSLGDPIELNEVLKGTFSTASVSPKWITSQLFVYRSQNDSILRLNLSTATDPTPNTIVDPTLFEEMRPVSNWYPSSNAKYIAFAFDAKKRYKRSHEFSVKIFTVERKSQIAVQPPNAPDNQKISLFLWDPSKDSEAFAFVYNNNIYYQKTVLGNAVPVTRDTEEYVYNGISDWLYEEEIFGTDSAMWFSPSGKYLAFVTFNDSAPVPLMQYPFYDGINQSLYPEIRKIPYSKVGEPIPTATLRVYSTDSGSTMTLFPPLAVRNLGERNVYLLSVSWLKTGFKDIPEPLMAVWSNRVQNHVYISICDVITQKCYLHYEKSYEDRITGMKLWVNPTEMRIHYSTPSSYFVLLPEFTRSNIDNVFTRVARVSVSDKFKQGDMGTPSFLTGGTFDVTKIVGFNPSTNETYYIAASPLPRNRHLYKYSLNDRSEVCVTCWMNESHDCSYVSASFSSDMDSYVLGCHGPGRPKTFIARISDNYTYLIENNTEVGNLLAEKAIPEVHHYSFMVNNYEALVSLIVPPGLNKKDKEQRYPLILNVYAGPGSQKILDSFRMGFDQYLASNRRYIIASVDARGSGGRGWKYKHPIYRNFGKDEITDQIATIQSLIKKEFFVNSDLMGVWGWSYGGFATAHIMKAGGNKVFKCGVSVAPVTDFRYYDAAYTERFMGLLSDNEDGYKRTDVMTNVTAFKSTDYLLVHGTGDDNVHFQNTAMLVKKLTSENIQFQLMIYPNQQHSLSADTAHLYTMLDIFFGKCFGRKTGSGKEL